MLAIVTTIVSNDAPRKGVEPVCRTLIALFAVPVGFDPVLERDPVLPAPPDPDVPVV